MGYKNFQISKTGLNRLASAVFQVFIMHIWLIIIANHKVYNFHFLQWVIT